MLQESRLTKMLKETVPAKLETLEGWLKQNKDGDGFFVGSSVSVRHGYSKHKILGLECR